MAAANPLSYAVDAARAMFDGHLADPGVEKGVASMAVLAAAAVVIAARAFSRVAA